MYFVFVHIQILFPFVWVISDKENIWPGLRALACNVKVKLGKCVPTFLCTYMNPMFLELYVKWLRYSLFIIHTPDPKLLDTLDKFSGKIRILLDSRGGKQREVRIVVAKKSSSIFLCLCVLTDTHFCLARRSFIFLWKQSWLVSLGASWFDCFNEVVEEKLRKRPFQANTASSLMLYVVREMKCFAIL